MALALSVALVGGLLARRVGMPPIIGYLFAGVMISPFTPGPSADTATIQEVAELGVIFLMFGIGLSFELSDLRAVGKVTGPGSTALMLMMTGIGFGIGRLSGLQWEASLILGFAISVSSSAALSRTLVTRGLTGSVVGRVSIGWAAVEDLATVVMLAIIPALGGEDLSLVDLGFSVLRAGVFVGLMLFVGPRVVPPVLRFIAGLGSRELFILAVVVLALGIASAATLFEVSVALGAFVAGIVLSETEMGHQATADVLPLREAFAVLFFVSVGMLLDPARVLDSGWVMPAVVAAVVLGRVLLIVGIFALLPYSGHQALLIGVSLAQIGEFSFLIIEAAFADGVIGDDVYNIVLTAAVLSLIFNQLLFRLVPRGEQLLAGTGPLWRALSRGGAVPEGPVGLTGHVVIVGYGRVGELIGHAMDSAGEKYVIIEESLELARLLTRAGRIVVWGDAATASVLERAAIDEARLVVICLPDGASTVLVLANARRISADVPILVRGHDSEDLQLLRSYSVRDVVVPEFEGGLELMHQSLLALGFSEDDAEGYRLAVRDVHYGAAAQHETVHNR